MDDILIKLENHNPITILDKVEVLLANYGLKLNRDKCCYTSDESDESVEFMNIELRAKRFEPIHLVDKMISKAENLTKEV